MKFVIHCFLALFAREPANVVWVGELANGTTVQIITAADVKSVTDSAGTAFTRHKIAREPWHWPPNWYYRLKWRIYYRIKYL